MNVHCDCLGKLYVLRYTKVAVCEVVCVCVLFSHCGADSGAH